MHSKSANDALRVIKDNIVLADIFIAGLDRDAFTHDRKSVYAVVRCLEIISEASRRIGEDVKARHASVPCDRIAGAGNIYRHEYDNVLESYIWTTVKERVAASAAWRRPRQAACRRG